MKRGFIVGLTLAVVLAVSACSSDSDTPDASTDAEPAATTSGSAAYTANDYSFDGPETLAAGTADITVENTGAVDHEMTLIRLDKNQDWTEEQIVEYVQSDPQAQPKWAVPVGGLYKETGPPIIAPGETASVVFLDFSANGQPAVVEDGALEPGTYLLMCFAGKSPFHAGMGMVKKITVS